MIVRFTIGPKLCYNLQRNNTILSSNGRYMAVEQANNPADPYSLEGKNLRRVLPQVRRSIQIQRLRVRAHIVTFLVCLGLGIVGCRLTGIWFGVGCVLLLMSPISIIGVFADRHLMKWHQQRLLECERRLNKLDIATATLQQ